MNAEKRLDIMELYVDTPEDVILVINKLFLLLSRISPRHERLVVLIQDEERTEVKQWK